VADYFLILTLVLVQPKADDDPEGDGAGGAREKAAEGEAVANAGGARGDTQSEASTVKTVAGEVVVAGVDETSPKVEIPHQPEV
jgi:hypothetical protein